MSIKIGSNVVIDNSRKLTNIADGSGELSLSGDTLTLSIGGTNQDTQSLQTLTVDQSLKLTTARTITLSGDVSGSTTFDGSANKTITTTVANDSHTHDTRYVKGGCCGGTLNVPNAGNPYGECSPGVDHANVKAVSGVVHINNSDWLSAVPTNNMDVYLNSRTMYTTSSKCQVLVFSSAYNNYGYSCCAFE